MSCSNSGGWSDAASSSGSVAPLDVPAPPDDVTALAANHSALVSWRAPSSDGGSPVETYTVQGRASDGSTALNVTFGKWSTSTWMSNLQNLHVWTFNVTACSEVGCGDSSTPSIGVMPADHEDPPDAVTGLAASPAVRAVTLEWTHPANSELWPIVNYTIVVRQGDSVVQLFNVSGVIGDRGCIVPNLTAGQLFEFDVFAWNVNGAGANASTMGRPASRETPPDAPFSVIATTAGGTVTVTWHMPHDFGGATALSNCSVFVAPSAVSAPPAVVPFPHASTSFVNLIDNVGYSFAVSCANDAGSGPLSLPSNVVYLSRNNVTVPGPPLYPALMRTTNDSATVGFLPPSSSGGYPVNRYTVGVTDTLNGSSWSVDRAASLVSDGVTVTGLIGGRMYTACVWAWNGVGEGAASANVSVVPITPPPPPPTNVRGVNVTRKGDARGAGVNVTWDAVAVASTASVVYTIVPIPDGKPMNVTGAGNTSAWVDGLHFYEGYFFRVQATVLGAGASALSQQVSGRDYDDVRVVARRCGDVDDRRSAHGVVTRCCASCAVAVPLHARHVAAIEASGSQCHWCHTGSHDTVATI